MEEKRIRVLNVEDEDVDQMALVRFTKENGLPYDIDRAATLAEALKMRQAGNYDIVLLDYMMPDGTGLDLLENIKGIPSIFITGSGNEMVAVKAIKGGAHDYLIKDTAGMYLELLPVTIENALRTCELQKEKEMAEEALKVKLDEERRLNNILLQREFRIKELKEENEKLMRRVEELDKK
ncbi:MAG: response regulator [Deltaproteobacteria bacterium]